MLSMARCRNISRRCWPGMHGTTGVGIRPQDSCASFPYGAFSSAVLAGWLAGTSCLRNTHAPRTGGMFARMFHLQQRMHASQSNINRANAAHSCCDRTREHPPTRNCLALRGGGREWAFAAFMRCSSAPTSPSRGTVHDKEWEIKEKYFPRWRNCRSGTPKRERAFRSKASGLGLGCLHSGVFLEMKYTHTVFR